MSCAFRPTTRLFAALGVALATLAVAAPAAAYPEAPGILQEELDLACLPSCLLCHTRPEGGRGFTKGGADMFLPGPQGLGAFFPNLVLAVGPGALPKESNLVSYLVAFKRMPCGGVTNTMNPMQLPCDSDLDGRSDLLELTDGTDPDVPDVKGPNSCVTPQYGCGASIQPLPQGESDVGRAVALMAALGVGLVLARRARR
jgi:hypothetical protein